MRNGMMGEYAFVATLIGIAMSGTGRTAYGGMKRILAFCCAGGFLVLAASGAVPGAERTGPRLSVKESRHDFGTVVEGTKAVHLFELRNEGDAPLQINKVHAS